MPGDSVKLLDAVPMRISITASKHDTLRAAP